MGGFCDVLFFVLGYLGGNVLFYLYCCGGDYFNSVIVYFFGVEFLVNLFNFLKYGGCGFLILGLGW